MRIPNHSLRAWLPVLCLLWAVTSGFAGPSDVAALGQEAGETRVVGEAAQAGASRPSAGTDSIAYDEIEEGGPQENAIAEFFKSDFMGAVESIGTSWSWEFSDGRLRYQWKNLFKRHNLVSVPVDFEETRLRGSIGARARIDALGFRSDGALSGFKDGVYLRSVRLFTQGSYFAACPTDYSFTLGIETGSFVLTDFFLWFKEIPFADNVKFGNFIAPVGLERLSSSYSEPFPEKSGVTEALTPGYKTGFETRYATRAKGLTFAAGVYGDAQGNLNLSDATGSLARTMGRVTWLPGYSPDSGRNSLTHLGLSGAYVFSDSEQIRYRARSESTRSPFVIDTADINANSAFQFGTEAAHLAGPWLLQAEFLGSYVIQNSAERPDADRLFFWGSYLRASYLLTGEVRRYNLDRGTFGKPEPNDGFRFKAGPLSGGWEMAARIAYTDLSDRNIRGGRMMTTTAGLNWFWDLHTRWMFGYSYSTFTDGPVDGFSHYLMARFELDY